MDGEAEDANLGRWPAIGGEMAARFRAHDWAATPLGPVKVWPKSLRALVELMLASEQPAYIGWGPEHVSLYNDGYIPILGAKHPGALGRPYREVFAEIWDEYRPRVAEVMAGQAQFYVDQPVPLAGRPDRPMSWFTFSWTPTGNDEGRIDGFYCAAMETTERVLAEKRREEAEAELRESEARYRAFVTASSYAVYRMGPDWAEMRNLDGRGFVSDTAEPTENWMERYIHPDDRPFVRAAIDEAVREKGVFELEHRVVRADGTLGWTLSRAVPVLGAGGEILEWLGTARDVTARKESQDALRESEERQAFLLGLSDALRPLAGSADIEALASRSLGEHLGVDRVMYGEIDPGGETITVGRSWSGDGAAPLAGRFRIGDFGRFFGGPLREGRAVFAEDATNDPRITPEEYARSWAMIGVRSAIAHPIVKGGRLVAALVVQHSRPRPWTDTETKLVSEVAERTWEAAQRARAEETLAASEDQYRTLFASIDEGFCTVEVIFDDSGVAVDYRFLDTNPAFERQTGLMDAAGKTMRELESDHEEFWFEIYGRIVRTDEAVRFEHEAAALGRFYDVYAFRVGAPQENRVAIIFNDILPRKRADKERERLAALEASARAEAAERERISRELHDRVAHHMGVAHQSLELFAALREGDPGRAEERLALARQSARLALDQTRALSAELKRLQEEELEDGLGTALEALAESSVPDGVRLDVSASGEEAGIPNPIALQVYLAMREAVRNAARHSGCSRIGITLDVSSDEVVGSVEDDGAGFDPGAVDRATPSWGVGLRSMRERTEMLGGGATVDSSPGSGTRVEVRVPLDGRRGGGAAGGA